MKGISPMSDATLEKTRRDIEAVYRSYGLTWGENADEDDDAGTLEDDATTRGLLDPPAAMRMRLRALDRAVESSAREVRDQAHLRADEARRAARGRLIDGSCALAEYRAQMARIDAALATQCADVPARPDRAALRVRLEAEVAEMAARWYEAEVDRLEQALAAWRPAVEDGGSGGDAENEDEEAGR